MPSQHGHDEWISRMRAHHTKEMSKNGLCFPVTCDATRHDNVFSSIIHVFVPNSHNAKDDRNFAFVFNPFACAVLSSPFVTDFIQKFRNIVRRRKVRSRPRLPQIYVAIDLCDNDETTDTSFRYHMVFAHLFSAKSKLGVNLMVGRMRTVLTATMPPPSHVPRMPNGEKIVCDAAHRKNGAINFR